MSSANVDMSKLDRDGHLVYEGLVTLDCDGEVVQPWGRIYRVEDEDYDLSLSPLAMARDLDLVLVVTSRRPDIRMEDQQWYLPPSSMRRSTTEPGSPFRLRVPSSDASSAWEADACLDDSIYVCGPSGYPAYWVAELRIVSPGQG